MKEYFGAMTVLVKLSDCDEDFPFSFNGVLSVSDDASCQDLREGLMTCMKLHSGLDLNNTKADFVIFCQIMPNELP